MTAVIGKQVLAFGKSQKSEFINIGSFAAWSGGRKGRRHIRRFMPDRERSHVWWLKRKCVHKFFTALRNFTKGSNSNRIGPLLFLM